MSRKILLISVILVLFIGVGVIIYFYAMPKANVQIITSPRNSVIRVGDQQIEQGKPMYIKKGTYQLTVEAPDFTAIRKEITTGDELKNYAFCLQPTNKSLDQYLEENPGDRLTCEGAGSQEYGEMSRKAIEAFPILEQLPYEDGTFIIGQGRNGNNEITLTVHYSTDKSKQEAVEWITKTSAGKPIPELVYFPDYVQTSRVGGVDSRLDVELRQKYPIILDLPLNLYIYKLGYRIDSSDPTGKSIKLTIESDTAEGRAGALRHIRTLGYNPTDYKIEFINYQERGLR